MGGGGGEPPHPKDPRLHPRPPPDPPRPCRRRSRGTAPRAVRALSGAGAGRWCATPRAGVDLETAKAALWEQIESLKQPPITPAELARVKNDYVTGLIYAQDDVSTQARLIGSINMIGQSDTLLKGLPERLAEISSESLNQTAKEVFDPDKAFVFDVNPKSAKLDTQDKS